MAADASFATLIEKVESFRSSGMHDFAAASRQFATADGALALARLGTTLWHDVDAEVGWSWFLDVAPVALIGIPSGSSLAVFYNPWADVYLFTQWRTEQGAMRIVDADVYLGDWVRSMGRGEFNAMPLWLRERGYYPAALGVSTAESIRAVERAYENWNGTDWRTVLGSSRGQSGLQTNYEVARLRVLVALANIQALSEAEGNDPVARLRAAQQDTLKELTEGRAAAVLARASATPVLTRTVVATLAPGFFERLQVAAAFAGHRDGVVFLVPEVAPAAALALSFDRDGDAYSLRRIDLVSYAGYYAMEVERHDLPTRDGGVK